MGPLINYTENLLMLHCCSAVQCSAVQHCTIMYCVIHCTGLHCNILQTALYWAELYYTVYCTALGYTSTVLYCVHAHYRALLYVYCIVYCTLQGYTVRVLYCVLHITDLVSLQILVTTSQLSRICQPSYWGHRVHSTVQYGLQYCLLSTVYSE